MRTYLLLIIVAVQAVDAWSAPLYRSFALNGRFQCMLPKEWNVRRDKERDEKEKIYGVEAVRPESAGPAALIAVEYYSRDNRLFRSPEDFIEHYRKAASELPLPGDMLGAVQDLNVRGYPAKRFEQKSDYPFPINSAHPRTVTIRKEYVLIPRKQGFFVLRYSAPADLFAQERPRFERALKTFSTPLP